MGNSTAAVTSRGYNWRSRLKSKDRINKFTFSVAIEGTGLRPESILPR